MQLDAASVEMYAVKEQLNYPKIQRFRESTTLNASPAGNACAPVRPAHWLREKRATEYSWEVNWAVILNWGVN